MCNNENKSLLELLRGGMSFEELSKSLNDQLAEANRQWEDEQAEILIRQKEEEQKLAKRQELIDICDSICGWLEDWYPDVFDSEDHLDEVTVADIIQKTFDDGMEELKKLKRMRDALKQSVPASVDELEDVFTKFFKAFNL